MRAALCLAVVILGCSQSPVDPRAHHHALGVVDGGSLDASDEARAAEALLECSPPCRFGRRVACDTLCGAPGFRQCNPVTGCFGPCVPPPGFVHPEACNGADDDCDGDVDEGGGEELCDDSLECTDDICLGSDGCSNPVSDDFCNDGAQCSIDFCGPPPAGAMDPRDTVIGPDAQGCFYLLRTSWCSDTFDACNCNGRETCNPPVAATLPDNRTNRGCVPDVRANHPCELDGNLCSLEICCEENTSCRFYEQRGIRPRQARRIFRACRLGTEAEPHPGPEGNGWCGTDPEFPEDPEDAFVQCDDGIPCTVDSCDPATGTCVVSAFMSPGTRPDGCDEPVNGGCGQQECDGAGHCTVVPRDPEEGDFCSGIAPGTCFRHVCVSEDECGLTPDDSVCDDNDACNGPEACGGHIEQGAGVQGGPAGCHHVRASDGLDCTRPRYMFESCFWFHDDTCRRPANACERGEVCTEDGCMLGPEVCGDGDPCTKDECFCLDEFCTNRRCEHTPSC